MELNEIEQLKSVAKAEIAAAKAPADIEALRSKYLGKKGVVKDILASIGTSAPEIKKDVGRLANELKNEVEAALAAKSDSLGVPADRPAVSGKDVTVPGSRHKLGRRHPIYSTLDEICTVFGKLGFAVVYGPEIENEFNNFDALNIPSQHPARDAFDTFYVDKQWLLRSHTSPVQIRAMQRMKPPIRILVPGKVYRPDTPDAKHFYMFHQVEGLMIDEKATFSDLKGVLALFAKLMFGENTKTRFRPSFFPFTEPSAEMDVTCIICKGKGCSSCGNSGWMEILGSGMVHPKVLSNVGHDPAKYQGFAFGMGVERVAMARYQIDDIRLFTENNLRFLRQF